MPGSSRPAAPPARNPVPALDDSELLVGDPSAATALHDRVRPQIDRTICRLLTPDDVDHDDIALQAMIELVSTIGKYHGACALDSWTSTITARVVYKHIRRRKLERSNFGTLDPDSLGMMRSDSRTGREAVPRKLIPRVLKHLAAIDEGRAWTFVLHDVCGYDLREIAQKVHERIAVDPELANLVKSTDRKP